MRQGAGPPEERTAGERRVRVDARVFGTYSVTVDGVPVQPDDWSRVAARQLFKVLLVTPNHRVSREAAGEMLWPEMDPQHQATNLRKALHFARAALERDQPVISATGVSLGLAPSVDLHLDLDDWAEASGRLRARAAQLQHPASGPDVELVLRLGGEDLLPDDPYEDWLAALRERICVLWRSVALDAVAEGVEAGRLASSQALLETLLVRDPADEDAHRLLIGLLASQGWHHAARRQFFRCRRELAAAFGTAPSPETVAAVAGAAAAVDAGKPHGMRHQLIGRHAELATIEETLDAVRSGTGAAIVVSGPAGIGKSRLIGQVCEDVSALGWRVLEGRALEDAQGLTYAPLRMALEALAPGECASWPEPAASAAATLAPRVGLSPAIRFATEAALVSGLRAVVDVLAASSPLILALDDAQWLDPATAVLLLELSTTISRAPVLLVLGIRTDERLPVAVDRLLTGLGKLEATELELGPLRPRDTGALVTERLGGLRLEPALAAFLAERSSGNPLFCLELARMLRDDGRMSIREDTWRITGRLDPERIPRSAARLVRLRSSHLHPSAFEVLALAAETGDAFTFERIAGRVADGGEAVLAGLDEGLRVGLLVEEGAGYRFAHPLFRTAVQRQVAPGRRAMLCLAVASAVAGDVDPRDPAAVEAAAATWLDPGFVADRALQACEGGAEEAGPLAVAFGLAAGRRQDAVLQRQAARETLERALAIWHRMPAAERGSYAASPGLRTLGDILLAAGSETEAVASYREAVAAATDPEHRAAAWIALAWVSYRHADYESAISIIEEGLGRSQDPLLRAILLIESGWIQFRHQRLDQSLELLQEAERSLRAPDRRAWRMRAIDSLWGPLESLGRGDEAAPLLAEALDIALGLRDTTWEQRIRTHLAFRMVLAGTPARARPHADRATSLARMMGDVYAESVATWAAWEMEYALGDDEAAERRVRDELALLARVGGNPRHEALARTRWAHLARRQGDRRASEQQATLARAVAERAGATDPPFRYRIETYLAARNWVPMSQ